MWSAILGILNNLLEMFAKRRENTLLDAKKSYSKWRILSETKKIDRRNRAALLDSVNDLVSKESKLP